MVRYRAVESLGEMGDLNAVEPLIEALKDRGWVEIPVGKDNNGTRKGWVRHKAIEALVKIGDDRAVAPITEALNDKQEIVRQAAQRALETLQPKSSG